ncbi:MAG: tRNA (adenosine(37)-N6)-threonylcarbamoyltransferase complex transferase subunit TsaD, partial [Pseudomonadota bacterium]
RLLAAQGGLWGQDIADLCAAFQAAVRDVLGVKSARAMRAFRADWPDLETPVIAVAGGVAANRALRAVLEAEADKAGFGAVAPPLPLCTDNGAMIAWAGAERLAAGAAAETVRPRPRWPLDAGAAPMLGAGRKGAKA